MKTDLETLMDMKTEAALATAYISNAEEALKQACFHVMQEGTYEERSKLEDMIHELKKMQERLLERQRAIREEFNEIMEEEE